MKSEYDVLKADNAKIQQNIDSSLDRIKKLEQSNQRLKKSLDHMELQQSLILMYLAQNKSLPSTRMLPSMNKGLNDIGIIQLLKHHNTPGPE